jgi:hypothetical protein
MAGKPDSTTEEIYEVELGSGMYTSELNSNIPDGFSPVCYNMVATGDSLENRIGFRRPSVDWKIQDPLFNYSTSELVFTQLDPWSESSSQPAFAWSARGRTVPGDVANSATLNFVRAQGTVDANDGFMSVVIPAPVIGIAQYRGTIYFSQYNSGVKKITGFNWAADSMTYSAVASSSLNNYGLISFKDRLWAYENSYLKYTQIASIGGLPENWGSGLYLIPIVGPNGEGKIRKIVPLGNKLGIFTTNGLFALTVEGEPSSWILRVLDSQSISTSYQCAFESKGVIYYINTQGVWATNLLTTTKLSGVIEDQFFQATGARVHYITSYEDGLLASIAKTTGFAIATSHYDKENCRIFYTKLDPIAWTEWNMNRNGFGTSSYQMAAVISTTDKIPTYLNGDPTVYAMLAVTDSTAAATQKAVALLTVLDGGSDNWVTRANVVQTTPVGVFLKTKGFDAGNAIRLKRLKQAYLEAFTSDAAHSFEFSWDLDTTTSIGTEVRTSLLNDFTVGIGSNILRVPADFRFRRAAFNLRTELQSDTSQIKIKSLTTVIDTGRQVVESVG